MRAAGWGAPDPPTRPAPLRAAALPGRAERSPAPRSEALL